MSNQYGEVKFRSFKSWKAAAEKLSATVTDDSTRRVRGDTMGIVYMATSGTKGKVNIGIYDKSLASGWLYDPMEKLSVATKVKE